MWPEGSHGRPRFLLVRAVNWIGDAVMTTPALSALRAAFPGTRIVLAARPPVAELFRHHPSVDAVLVYDKAGRHRGVFGLLRMASELRRERFAAALLLQNAFDAALLAFLAGIPERAGYATDGRRLLLTRAVPVDPATLTLHEVEYYLRLLADLGIPRPAEPALSLRVTDGERRAVRDRLAGRGLSAGRPFIVVNPGAAYGSSKRWYPDRFAAAADALSEEWDAAVVLIGTAAEAPLAGDIGKGMRRPFIDLSGATTVREMMALLSEGAFLVTNDSGPMHVAAALGVPLVAVFGPTDWRRTSPWRARAEIVRAGVDCAPCRLRECDRGHECMKRVTPEMVVEAARRVAAGRTRETGA